jgi:hypothetical protein
MYFFLGLFHCCNWLKILREQGQFFNIVHSKIVLSKIVLSNIFLKKALGVGLKKRFYLSLTKQT